MGLPGSSLTRTYQRLAAELIGLALFVIVAMAISIRLRLFAQYGDALLQAAATPAGRGPG